MNRPMLSNSESAPGERRIFDICCLFALALLVYGQVWAGNRVIPTIDLITHYRWLSQFSAAIESGVWYPIWMPMAEMGLGEPHYNTYLLYYYASSLLVAAGLNTWSAIKAITVLSSFAGAVIIYREFHPLAGRKVAMLAGCFWQLAPFPFFLISNYSALPWHFSLVLALQFILMSLLPVRRFGRVKIAVVAMALIFSHVLVAFMTFVSLGLTMIYLGAADANRRAKILIFWVLPTLVGVLLTAFHLLPALATHSLWQLDPEQTRIYLNWRDSFIFPTFSFMLWGGRWFSMQWIYPGLALLGAVASSLVLWRFKDTKDDLWKLLLSLTIFTFVGLTLGSEVAFPLYFLESPFLALQWPYRFVTIGCLGATLALPIAIFLCHQARETKFLVKMTAAAAMLATVAVFGFLQLQLLREGRDPQLTPERLAGNFNAVYHVTNASKWREYVQSGGLSALCQRVHATCVEGKSNSQYRVWEIEVKETTNLVFPLFAFPAWSVRIDGDVIASTTDRDTGLIAVAIPPGKRKVEIEFADMPQSRAGVIASLVGLLGLLLLGALDFRLVRKGAEPAGSPV